MKPTSIISLIVAFLLVVAGLVTCFVAQNIASANGEFIFAESRGDDLVNTIDVGEDISKIELIFENAEVNIRGGSDKSYIEFVNFSENYYSLSKSNTIISFDELPDLMSMLKFWENGFSFKGMRYILNFSKPSEDVKKSVNVYLTKDQNLKIIDIKSDNCTLNIENIEINCDYKIFANDVTVNANTLKTDGTFTVNCGPKEERAKNVNLNISYALVKNLNIASENLTTDIDVFKLTGESNITCDSGNISIKLISDPTLSKLDISTEGALTINDLEYLNTFESEGDPNFPGSFIINTQKADINISKTNITAPQN